jgi:hypothetical protein
MTKRTCWTLALTLALGGLLLAQEKPNIRNPDIDTASPEGQALASAGVAEESAEKIKILEGFLGDFSDSKHRGYALMQLLGLYTAGQQFDKAVEVGRKLLEIVPQDLEVRHNVNQALLQLQRWDELQSSLDETRPIAEQQASATQPAGLDEDEAAAWKFQVEYANGVVDWLEWGTNTAMLQQTEPQAQISWMDRLREGYPDSDYSKGIESRYVIAYQQLGDQAKMTEWMKAAVDAGYRDEAYLYSLAQDALNRQDNDAAKAYAEQALQVLETKAAPEGTSEEAWTSHKAQFSAYSSFVLGSIEVAKNTKDSYRAGRTHLLKAVDVLKAEGGPRYHILAYYLGVCYVQLDIQGDNIKQATYWMREAANTEGPFKAQAQEALKKIAAA